MENKRLKKLLKEMKNDCKEAVGLRFPTAENNGELFGYAIEDYEDIVGGEVSPIACEDIFETLQDWYLDNTHYQILEHKNSELATDYFARSSAYGHLALYVGVINFYCPKTHGQSFYLLDEATSFMSQALLCGWEEEYESIGDWIISSIDYGYQDNAKGEQISQIVAAGTDDMLPGWFLLDLYCLVFDKKYDSKNAKYPKDMLIYKEILENWNSKDMVKVDKMVYLMSEYHLEETKEVKNSEEEYYMFDDVRYWLFPYEILTWLKLRERQGLENPKKFSHPLMNTEIAKFYLGLQTPLPKPTELPYAKELLEKLQTLCTHTHVPKWLKQ
ncbi:MAG TPA: hypothetical protein EYG82_01620 [Sulfurovum sp.]|nr:hypothetical protein [Sulfurovum sp.]